LSLEWEEERDFAITVLDVRVSSTFEKCLGEFKMSKWRSTCMVEGCVAGYIRQIWWCTTLKEIVDNVKMLERIWGGSSDSLCTENSK
jgi:hypothetical protein